MNRRSTTQDITWLLDLNRNGQLDLDPPYQRKSVWTGKDRQFFLDTIFRDYPSPAIFLHKTMEANGSSTYHVVDGKQRLETILRFINNKIRIAKDFGDIRLDGKNWKQLDVVSQQVILIDARAADGRMLVETSMGSMPVVGMEPGAKLLAALL